MGIEGAALELSVSRNKDRLAALYISLQFEIRIQCVDRNALTSDSVVDQGHLFCYIGVRIDLSRRYRIAIEIQVRPARCLVEENSVSSLSGSKA